MAISLQHINEQFQGLNPNDLGRWPPVPKWIVLGFVMLGVLVAGWFFYIDGKLDELKAAEVEEEKHKKEYSTKLVQAINLDALKKQKEEVGGYVLQMEKQLPSKAEMDQLLSDINHAGIGRGLQFELFKPGVVAVKDYYAELPITIRITGSYHKLANFAADISALPRIVTLNDMSVNYPSGAANAKDPTLLSLDAIAKTFRYLDPEEVSKQRKEKEGVKK